MEIKTRQTLKEKVGVTSTDFSIYLEEKYKAT